MDTAAIDSNDRLRNREARAEECVVKAPTDLTTAPSLVAFIDVLGFGNEIQSAVADDDLYRAYKKIRLVQKEFQKPSAADNPDEQLSINLASGRRVIALSDAAVVAITPNNHTCSLVGTRDLFGFAIYEMMLAQAVCVASYGIFVRGGISHGPFFFGDDVLPSPALARAYELESRFADYPLIVIPESTRPAILDEPSEGYAVGEDPTPQFFNRHGRRRWERGSFLLRLFYCPN